LVIVAVSYAALTLAGLTPVNRTYVPSPDGIAIYIASNGVHTDIMVPITTNVFDWRTILLAEHFQQSTTSFEYVALGWGDREFYVNTPAWEDMSAITTARAMLLPTDTIMHAQFGYVRSESDSFRKVSLSVAQYERLVASLRSSFQLDTVGNPIRLNVEPYNRLDCFYRGAGTYHALNTCNCWTGRMLRETGVKAGWFTPTPNSVMFHLPDESSGEDDTNLPVGHGEV
jgi:uncharacterized protein (TIGR02117 family)